MVDKASLKSGRDAENIFLDPDKEFVKTRLGCEILFFFPGRKRFLMILDVASACIFFGHLNMQTSLCTSSSTRFDVDLISYLNT